MSWFSIPKTFVEETKAKAAEVNENFTGVKNALLYLLSEEGHSPFPQLPEAAKRFLTMAADVTLYGPGGVSQFLQLAGAVAKRKVSFGTGVVNFSGGSHLSDQPQIAHGLGVDPIAVVMTSTHPAVNMACEGVVVSATTVGARGVWCWDDFYAEGNYIYYWIAIG